MSEETQEFKRPAILNELDTYNTAPPADSIMESILLEEEANQGRQTQDLREQQTPEAQSTSSEPVKKELPSDYLPLNTSIQDLSGRVDQRLTNLERGLSQRLDNLASSYQAPQQQPAQPQFQYDPEAPVTMAQLSQLLQGYQNLNATTNDALKNSIRSRAYAEYLHYQKKNPDFDIDPVLIDQTIDQAFRNKQIDLVKDANWRGHFEQMHAPQRMVKLQEYEKTVSDLRKEIEDLKKKPSAPVKTTPVSPAVGRSTGRAIESPTNQMNDDILDMKSFKQKGNFKGFGNDMKRKLAGNK